MRNERFKKLIWGLGMQCSEYWANDLAFYLVSTKELLQAIKE